MSVYQHKIKLFTLLILYTIFSSQIANAQDSSDIWVGKLHLGEKHPITDLVRITDNTEYTNQPYFFDNTRLFFTQALTGEAQTEGEDSASDQAQMDIMRFNLLTGELSNITQSQDSEYSATPLPNKPGFSVIKVNNEGLQELWEISPLGKPQQNLAPLAEPVGYQVWLNQSELLLFILGEPQTLQRFNTATPQEPGIIINDNVGASLFRFKQSNWFLYTRESDGHFLNAYNAKTNRSYELLRMPANTTYFSLSDNGGLLTSDSETFWYLPLQEDENGLSNIEGFTALPIKHEYCNKGISRTAVSPDMTMIALVCPNGRSDSGQ